MKYKSWNNLNFIQGTIFFTWNQKVIELDYVSIKKLSEFVEDENFTDTLLEPLNRGYIVYVECNW